MVISRRNTVPVAGWLTCHDHSHRLFTSVHSLMLLSRSDLQPLPCEKQEVMVFHFHRQFSFEYEEKLPSSDMKVTLFLCSRRHQFFDNAQIGGLDQMPAIARVPTRTAPLVVFSGFSANDLRRHRSTPVFSQLQKMPRRFQVLGEL